MAALPSLALITRPYRRRFYLSVALSALLAFLEVVALGLLYSLVNLASGKLRPSGPVGALAGRLGLTARNPLLIALAISICVIYVVKGIAAMSLRRWTIHLLLVAESTVQERLFNLYLRAPLRYHLSRHSATFVRNLTQTLPDATVRGLNGVSVMLTEALLLVATFSTAFLLEPIPALLGAVYFGALGFVIYRVIRPRHIRAAEQYIAESETTMQTLAHAFGGIREILVSGRHGGFSRLLSASRAEIVESQTANLFYGEMPRYVLEVGLVLGIAPIIAVVLSTSGANSTAGIALFLAIAFRALPSVSRLLQSCGVAVYSRVAAVQLLDTAEEIEESIMAYQPVEPVPSAPKLDIRGRIEFDNVSFAYGGDRSNSILHNVCLRLEPGEYLGIVGQSGSGKSTLLDLLVGLQRPTSGRITVDGTDMRAIQDSWRSVVGYVPQQTFILDRSVLENVAFGESVEDGADEERVWEALRSACVDQVIRRLPDGLGSRLGERGTQLSGGQQQRIGIARALYRQPRLLALDEATSALDVNTEREIFRLVEGLAGQVTVVVVTHRVASLERCGRVLSVESGEVRLWEGTPLNSASTANGLGGIIP